MSRRLAIAGTLFLALLPSPAAANGGEHVSALNLPLAVAAGLVLVLALGLRTANRGRPWSWVALGAALLLGGGAIALPRLAGEERPEAEVAIVEPRDGAEVSSEEPVTVRVRLMNGQIATSPQDTEGGHLHLYLDGHLQQMPYSTEATIEVRPGTHEITVEFVDHQHVSYDPPIQATVKLMAG